MGKDAGFYILKNLGYNLANLYNKVDVQTSKLVKNDTEYIINGT